MPGRNALTLGLRRVLADPALFSQHVIGRSLRPYQLEPLRAAAGSVQSGQGRTFTVMFARQMGKNETSAHLECYLLNLYQRQGGSLVKTAPTYQPQTVNSKLRLLAALGLALLMGPRRGMGLDRAAVYMPTIVPEAAYALIWLWILNPVSGPLNLALAAVGLPAPDWLTQAGTARLAIILMALLQIGEGFVVLLIARQSIPAVLYEAAEIDGANRWQGFWRITLPLIVPWLLLLVCRDLVVSVQNTFAPSYILAYGGPYYATTFLPLLIYELSFDFTDLGLASAVLVVVYVWILLLIWQVRNLIAALRGRGAADEV